MRITIIGAGGLACITAELFAKRGHEVVLIERDPDRVRSLSERIDCGFIVGDGTKPEILREADPQHSDFLFCLTGNDQANIIASLVGRHLGFSRVVPKIEDREFEAVCIEMGLDDVIIPDQATAASLDDLVRGHTVPELSGAVGAEVRFFSFYAHADAMLSELELPERAQLVGVTRGDTFLFPSQLGGIKAEDEVLLATHMSLLDGLRTRFSSRSESSSD